MRGAEDGLNSIAPPNKRMQPTHQPVIKLHSGRITFVNRLRDITNEQFRDLLMRLFPKWLCPMALSRA